MLFKFQSIDTVQIKIIIYLNINLHILYIIIFYGYVNSVYKTSIHIKVLKHI